MGRSFWWDLAHKAQTEEERQSADDLISLLTPVIKGVFTDKGYENATNSQQVLGGHGYIREWGMEQFVRDARIAMIYEGTNGIQALDLVGRKLGRHGGRAVQAWFKLVGDFIKDNGEGDMDAFTKPLAKALKDLQAATMWLMQHGMKNPDNAGAAATSYMHLMGLVAIGYMWAKMAKASYQALENGASDTEFYKNKLITGRYYMARTLSESSAHLAKIEAGAEPVMALAADAF